MCKSRYVAKARSLGGSIVARLAERRVLPRLLGVAIIDIVEGYAMDVLGHMRSYFQRRPASFASLPEAIEWQYGASLTMSLTL